VTTIVTAIAGMNSFPLSDEPVTVPATQVVLSIDGNHEHEALLDGRRLPLNWQIGQTTVIAIDLTRSTGFHHLQIGQKSWWFATEDAKLGLDGIEAMLRYLRSAGTGWSGQLLFTDGAVLRDPHVVYGWLDANADQTLDAIERVLSSPRSVSRSDLSLTRRGGRSLHQAASLRLLRREASRYLEPSNTGLLTLDGVRYDPLRVVVRGRRASVESIANQRAAMLLSWVSRLVREVLSAGPEASVATRCTEWLAFAEALARRPLARTLVGGKPVGAMTLPRQTEEVVDRRYQATYTAARDLAGSFGWSASRHVLRRLSFVQRADTIYQAFVATVLADVLGLKARAPVLGQKSLAFAGPDFDLYYDSRPDDSVLRSWRYYSSRPDSSRPDLLLHRRATGEVLLIDAKYRIAGSQATEDSRKEVSAYMALYGLNNVVIAYPGSPAATVMTISGHGNGITELAISPEPKLRNDLVAALPQILAGLQVPLY
jgi:hypothetical protein